MVDSIVTGLGRKSLPILDNLGLSAVDIRKKMEEDMTRPKSSKNAWIRQAVTLKPQPIAARQASGKAMLELSHVYRMG